MGALGGLGGRQYDRLGKPRLRREDGFELGRVDVLAAGHDEVVRALVDEEIALVVLVADISAMEPAAGVSGFGRVRIAPVFTQQIGTAQQDLAALARRDVGAVSADDPRRAMRSRLAPGPDLP